MIIVIGTALLSIEPGLNRLFRRWRMTAAYVILLQCLDYFCLQESALKALKKSDPRKMLIAGLLRYHFPVNASWVSDRLAMGHFTTVSRPMKFFDAPTKDWVMAKCDILKFIG
jgi:hypothetical protein